MKILMIMAGFFPGKKYGGPPVSVDNFCSLMKDDNCYIVTCNHDKDEKTAYENIPVKKWVKRENCKVMYLTDEEYNKNTFEKIISKLKPDILYLQGLFQGCVLPCLQLSKKYATKVILAPRGELCAGAFKKKYKKIPYIAFMKINRLLQNVYYQSTSKEETLAIGKYLGANDNRIFYLTNIPSIPNREYERNVKEAGAGRFVFLSRIHPKKNLISAIRYFRKVSGNVVFDIYGPIEDRDYWEECQEEIRELPNNVQVNYCGLVSHEEVHSVFSKYDAFLFPTFSENYGHVIAEALIVGTPVIIGKGATPWDDVDGVAGFVESLSNEEGFVDNINKVVTMSNSEYMNLTEFTFGYIHKKLNLDNMKKDYEKIFKKITF